MQFYIVWPNDIKLHVSSGEKLLGLDIGKKTIGLALSDASLKVASPVKILYRKKFTPDMAHLLEFADSQSVGGPANALRVSKFKQMRHIRGEFLAV